MRRPHRAPILLGAALAGLLATGSALAAGPSVPSGGFGPPPEQQTGSIGNYVIPDSDALTSITCRYDDRPVPRLKRVVVRPPEMTWPDTDSEVDHQKGTVGYRAVIERSTDGRRTWQPFRRSGLKTATASEDGPADLDPIRIDIADTGLPVYRAMIKLIWFRKDGSARGTVRHWQNYHHLTAPGKNPQDMTSCWLHWPID